MVTGFIDAEMSVVREGNCVLLSCRDSAALIEVRDLEEGAQIRLDGVVRRIAGDRCWVEVRLEGSRKPVVRDELRMEIGTWLRDVEVIEGEPHVWSELNAAGIDRVRRTGSEECDYWAPL